MDEFHALMSQLGMRNYTCAYPLQGEGPCIVTVPMLPSPPVLVSELSVPCYQMGRCGSVYQYADETL